ncbi:MAG: protein translocase subunit SecD, partial [Deltaproteobacteria bacterium]|nr:protein translocase subunit SecD [Deltaproteobacteria bacterium]
MSIRFRFLLIALFIGLAFVWLKPTYDWYFDTPQDRQVLAGSTKDYIRSYSKKQAASSFTELKNFLSNPEELISEEYKFLIKKAKKNYKLEKKDLPDEWTIEAVMDGFSSENELLATLEQYYRDDIQEMKAEKKKILNLGLDLMGGLSVTIEADKENLAERLEVEVAELTDKDMDDAIEKAMTTLSNRVNKFGVSEPQIRRQANHQILVEVPGKVDNTTVASFLHGKGTLNFHLVDNEATAKISDILRNNPGETFEKGRPENDSLLPENVLVLGVYTKDNYDIDELTTYLAVTKEPGLDGTKIKSAEIITNPDTLKPDVLFELTTDGAEDFYDLTSANIGKRLAIVMDGKIKEGAPEIRAGLSSSATMSGFDTKEAKNLEIILQTAALPIDLNVIDEQKVGALLGADT